MELSRLGETADSMWREIPQHHQKVKLDIHQVMPDHMHGIIILGHDELKFEEMRDVSKDPRRDVQLNVPPLNPLNVPPLNPLNVPPLSPLNVPPLNPLNVPPQVHSHDEDDIHIPWDECTNVPLGVNFPDNALLYNPRKKRSIGKDISPPKDSLSVVIRTFKAAVTTWARNNGIPEFRWHGRFHERILRDENHLFYVRRYIFNNPRNWKAGTRRIRKGGAG
ncbi:MAG: hypothetical protein WEB37_07150 [Bacteroidota bacterium]